MDVSELADSNGLKVLSQTISRRSVFGLACHNGVNDLYYKRPNDAAKAEHERQELIRVARETAMVAGISPVRLYDVDCGPDVLVTHFIRGTSAFNYLWNTTSRVSWKRPPSKFLAEIGNRLGRWLRGYHDSSRDSTAGTEAFIVKMAQSGIARVRAVHTKFPNALNSRALSALETHFQRLVSDPTLADATAVARIHGDLNLSNVLVTQSGELIVLDFGDHRIGLALEDLVLCWHTIAMMGCTSHRRKLLLQATCKAMLDGYGLCADIADSVLFRSLRYWQALVYILGSVNLRPGLSLRGWSAQSQMVRANCRWLEGCV